MTLSIISGGCDSKVLDGTGESLAICGGCFNDAPPGSDICDLPLSRFTLAKSWSIGGAVACFDISDDGLYLCFGEPLNKTISSFELDAAWDIGNDGGNRTLFGQYVNSDNLDNIDGISYADNGDQVWISAHTGSGTGQFIKYTLNEPYLFDATTNAPTRIGASNADGDGTINITNDINIKPDGTSIIGWGNDSTNNLFQYDMPALDIANLAYAAKSSTVNAVSSFVSPSGNCLFTGATDTVSRFGFGTPWDVTTFGSVAEDSLLISAETSVINGILVTADRMFVLGNATMYQYNA